MTAKKNLRLALALLACALCCPPARAAAAGFPVAVRDRIAWEYLRSVRYYLARYGESTGLVARLEKKERRILSAALAAPLPANPRQDELLDSLRGAVFSSLPLRAQEKRLVQSAVDETGDYFYVSGARLFEEFEAPRGVARASGPAAGFSPEIERLPREVLPMRDLEGYVRAQLGPMAELFAWLGPDLKTILFSRRPLKEALSLLEEPPAKLYRLNIPGSIYAFEAYLTEGAGKGLILCGFSGASWFTHVQSAYRLHFSRAASAPVATVDPSSGRTVPCPGVMEAFSGPLPKDFSGLLLGYFQELRKTFHPYVKKEHRGKGFRAFEAEIAGKTYIALETRDSWYGEILGETVRALLASGVRFDAVYFAGSAGSLKYHTPYTMARPACFFGRDGRRLKIANALAGAEAPLCHQTVPSPLAESRAYLSSLAQDAGTIDVEGLALVEAVRDHNAGSTRTLSLGLSYLITDYPGGLPATEHFALSTRRFEGKLRGTRRYAEFLLAHLTDGRLAYDHPIENSVGESVASLSRKNMERRRLELGPLTAPERLAFDKIADAAPPVIMRLGKHRLGRVLEAGLALAPEEVGILTGRGVSTQTFTPSAENELYGAWDYLFSGAGQNNRKEAYGAAQLFLSSAAWGQRSYATPFSGFRLGGDRPGWARAIVAPADYAPHLALAFISHARRSGGTGKLDGMARARTAGEVYRLLGDCDDCYLESKILKYFTLDEIDCLELPASMSAALPDLEKLRGRVFETPGACLRRLGEF